MKVIQIMIYFVILNAVFYMFSVIGVYSTAARLGVDESEWAISPNGGIQNFIAIGGFSGVAALGLGVLTMVIAIKGGVNPFLAMAYGVMTGLFVNMWLRVGGILKNIGTLMGEEGYIMDATIILITTIVGIMFMYTYVQMAAGGGKSYE